LTRLLIASHLHLFFTLSVVTSFPNMEVALPNMEVLSFVLCFRFKSI